MKQFNLTKSIALSFSTAALLMTTACSQPAERTAKIDDKIASNLVEIKSVSEATAKSVYVSGSNKKTLSDLDPEIKQVKLEGSNAEMILKKITGEKTKAALEEQLKDGGVALVVLGDQIKVLKVTNDLDLTLNYDVLSSKYIAKLKELSKATDAQQQSSLAQQLRDLKYVSPRAQNEKFGLVEITALKIEKLGVLDNDRTDYNEKKSILKVMDRPLNVATHMVVGGEVGASEESADKNQ